MIVEIVIYSKNYFSKSVAISNNELLCTINLLYDNSILDVDEIVVVLA